MRKFWDRALLIGVALLLCLTTGGSFLLGEIYHINPAWFFFAWGSIFLLPMLWKEFRTYFVRPGFTIFFVIWMIFHGVTVVTMIRWLPFVLWPLLLLFELGIGFAIAGWLFNLPLRKANGRVEQP